MPWQQTSAETGRGELRARVIDLWSSTLRWDVQSAGSQPRYRRKIFTHASCEGCDAGRNSERSLRGECSSDRKGHGTEKRQSSLGLYQARSGTCTVESPRIVMDVVWQRREARCRDMPRAHQSGYGVRRRGPARGATRQQHRPQELGQFRRARHRLQGLR